jgi:hypothetical protein
MPEHPVKLKLQQAILPYVVSAEQLRLQPVYVTYGVYTYIHEFLVALVGLGVAPPLLSLFNTESVAGGSQGTVSAAYDALKKLPNWLALTILGALVGWTLLKLIVAREGVAKRAVLARSCRKEMRQLSVSLREELQKPDPMPGLQHIQQAISEVVHRHVQEESWPWDGPAENIEQRLQKRLDKLCQQFQKNWRAAPEVDQIWESKS